MTLMDINSEIAAIEAEAKAKMMALINHLAAEVRSRFGAGALIVEIEKDVKAEIGQLVMLDGNPVNDLNILKKVVARLAALLDSVPVVAEAVAEIKTLEADAEKGFELLKDAAGLAKEASEGKLN